jgi:beta-lactamase regulating signal transducer with metallopeptidase domain
MIAAWMLYSVTVGVLIGVAAIAGDRFFRLVRLPVRWVWISGMVSTLVLSCFALIRATTVDANVPAPGIMEGYFVEESHPGGTDSQVMRAAASIAGAARDVRAAAAATAERVYHTAAAYAGEGRALVIAWGAGSAVLLLILCGTLLRLRRARMAWRSHRIADVDVLVSHDAGPALVGLVRPSIVVPAWLLAESPERQRLVVQHEDEHRRAGDHALLAVACMAVCLMPWNIALWWMLQRTRLAVELDCDERLLRRGVQLRSYAALLLEIAGRTRARPFIAPALADSRTQLERRLIAMTERTRTPGRARTAAAGLAALLLGAAACTADLPTSAEIDDMDVMEVEKQAEQAGLLAPLVEDGSPLFIVDGAIVESAAARGLEPDEIRSIEVVKGQAALRAYGELAEHGVIVVETRAPGAPRVLDTPIREPAGNAVIRRARTQDQSATPPPSIVEISELASRADSPLIVVNGVVAPESFSIRSLSRESIEKIEIIKGEAARALHDDPRAANGVIVITTRAGAR